MATALHNLSEYDFTKIPDASNMCFGIVVAEWNPEITGALLDGAGPVVAVAGHRGGPSPAGALPGAGAPTL